MTEVKRYYPVVRDMYGAGHAEMVTAHELDLSNEEGAPDDYDAYVLASDYDAMKEDRDLWKESEAKCCAANRELETENERLRDAVDESESRCRHANDVVEKQVALLDKLEAENARLRELVAGPDDGRYWYSRALMDEVVAERDGLRAKLATARAALEQAGRDICWLACAPDDPEGPHCLAHKDVMVALAAIEEE